MPATITCAVATAVVEVIIVITATADARENLVALGKVNLNYLRQSADEAIVLPRKYLRYSVATALSRKLRPSESKIWLYLLQAASSVSAPMNLLCSRHSRRGQFF